MEIGVRSFRDRLSHYLRLARDGEPIVITDHGRAVARLVPISGERPLDRLISDGLVQPARSRRRTLPTPVPAAGTVSDLVADQRR